MPGCTPLYRRTLSLVCGASSGCQFLSPPAIVPIKFGLCCSRRLLLTLPRRLHFLPSVSSSGVAFLLSSHPVPDIFVFGCDIFFFTTPAPSVLLAKLSMPSSPERPEGPKSSSAIRTATSGLLPQLSPFRAPEVYLPFRESLFLTRQRNPGVPRHQLQPPLLRVPLLPIRVHPPTLVWR